MRAAVINGDYPAGTVISGIQWRPEFTELDLSITNPTDDPYEDLNIVFRPSDDVAAVAQQTTFEGVTFEDQHGETLHMTEIGNFGRKSVPLTLLATDAGYRLRCAKLPAKSTIKLVMALTSIRWNPQKGSDGNSSPEDSRWITRIKNDDFSSYWFGYKTDDLYAPRPDSSSWVKVEGAYKFRHRKITHVDRINIGGVSVLPMLP